MKPGNPASLRYCTAPSGRVGESLSPAPLGSSVTEAGMFATTQCQKPDAVGASGSYTVTAKLWVPSGKPDQDSCGERSSPPAPITPLTCGWASGCPSEQSVLVTVKPGTWGRKSYGFGGTGRSAMESSLGLGRTADAALDRARGAGGTPARRSPSRFGQPPLQEGAVGRIDGEEERTPVVGDRAG